MVSCIEAGQLSLAEVCILFILLVSTFTSIISHFLYNHRLFASMDWPEIITYRALVSAQTIIRIWQVRHQRASMCAWDCCFKSLYEIL